MTSDSKLTLAVVAGEQSGENLAVDLVDELAGICGEAPRLVGVGGERLCERGLASVFDPAEIAITGVSAVAAALPRLLFRIRQTADAIVSARPDAVLMVDSPDFSHRVARRVRAKLPNVPIIKYVAPTVWAWRPGRARAMRSSFDQVLAVLPFEPEVMERLDGPQTHYVGHPLAADADLRQVWDERQSKLDATSKPEFDLLVLPGSRRGELRSLLPDFEKAVAILHERGNRFRIHMPALPRLADELRRDTNGWTVKPNITVSREEKINAFRKADAALAASGTVLLELALAGVPAVSCYRSDVLMRFAHSLITTWSAALPNLISDRPLVPEYINEMIRPGMLARQAETLADYGSPARAHQLQGFAEVRRLLETETVPGRKAAQILLSTIERRRPASG